MHIVIALRRRVRLFRLGAREGFEKKHQEVAADLELREGFEFFCASPLPSDARFDFCGSERAMGSRKKHQELAADLESREGFDMVLPFK